MCGTGVGVELGFGDGVELGEGDGVEDGDGAGSGDGVGVEPGDGLGVAPGSGDGDGSGIRFLPGDPNPRLLNLENIGSRRWTYSPRIHGKSRAFKRKLRSPQNENRIPDDLCFARLRFKT